jgi:hypothetical protein
MEVKSFDDLDQMELAEVREYFRYHSPCTAEYETKYWCHRYEKRLVSMPKLVELYLEDRAAEQEHGALVCAFSAVLDKGIYSDEVDELETLLEQEGDAFGTFFQEIYMVVDPNNSVHMESLASISHFKDFFYMIYTHITTFEVFARALHGIEITYETQLHSFLLTLTDIDDIVNEYGFHIVKTLARFAGINDLRELLEEYPVLEECLNDQV